MPRAYDNSRRARRAAQTAERIGAVTEELLASGPVGGVTLQAIAEGAGVTVQTVLRHMGSRDGCFAAAAERVGSRIEAQRGHTEPGDVEAAITELMTHYEAEGRLILHLLAQEGSGEWVTDEGVAAGREFHRAWVERCFGPLLPKGDSEAIDALVAATDLYVWKLLRLDLGRSTEAAEAVITRLVRAVLEAT